MPLAALFVYANLMNSSVSEYHLGIDNLLLRSVGVEADQNVLLVCEPDDYRFFEAGIGQRVAERIQRLGARPQIETHDLISDPVDFPAALTVSMGTVDHTIFLSRIGDYCRFTTLGGRSTKTICYARSCHEFASDFAVLDDVMMRTLFDRFEAELKKARHWRIRCELGTNIEGEFIWSGDEDSPDDDFTMGLFPVTTFIPVPCSAANGQVALTRWLMPGAASKVKNHMLRFDGVVTAKVKAGSISSFEGAAAKQVSDHYSRIAEALQLNRDRVHSWHAGFNPGTTFHGDPDQQLERWGAISFGSPRYLHFHTCGDIPPAELAWSVFNPRVEIDGEPWIADGQLLWLQREDNVELAHRLAPDATQVDRLLGPSAPIGI